MCGSLFYHFLATLTSAFDVDIQMITFMNSYDVGREGTIVTTLFGVPQYWFFILMDLLEYDAFYYG